MCTENIIKITLITIFSSVGITINYVNELWAIIYMLFILIINYYIIVNLIKNNFEEFIGKKNLKMNRSEKNV